MALDGEAAICIRGGAAIAGLACRDSGSGQRLAVFRWKDLAFYRMGRLWEGDEGTEQQGACNQTFKHDFWFNSDET